MEATAAEAPPTRKGAGVFRPNYAVSAQIRNLSVSSSADADEDANEDLVQDRNLCALSTADELMPYAESQAQGIGFGNGWK